MSFLGMSIRYAFILEKTIRYVFLVITFRYVFSGHDYISGMAFLSMTLRDVISRHDFHVCFFSGQDYQVFLF